jgi:carboxyl-terminal processing protease
VLNLNRSSSDDIPAILRDRDFDTFQTLSLGLSATPIHKLQPPIMLYRIQGRTPSKFLALSLLSSVASCCVVALPLSRLAWSAPATSPATADTKPTSLPADRLGANLQNSPKAVVDEVWQFINQYYVDPKFNRLDWAAIRTSLLSQRYSSPQAAYQQIRTTLAQLNDPYTRFLDPKEYGQLANKTIGEQRGVGIELTLKGEILSVSRVEANSVAAKAGVKLGDRVLSINGRSAERLSLERANQMLLGSSGTPLLLTISRGAEKPQFLRIVRDGQVEQTVRYEARPLMGTKIGYIRLTGFNVGSAQQMADAINALKKQAVSGFILDLRDNPGGLLDPGLVIARQFLTQGVIVQILEREGKPQQVRANNSALTNLPLVVLVNRESASASEVLAGALQDNRRATIVGTPTFGKALVQAMHELMDGSAVVVTVAHYYTPLGTDISTKGITPDVVVAATMREDQELRAFPQLWASSRDARYSRALEILASKIRAPNAPRPTAPTGRTGDSPSNLLR